jgi:hypothetical protein
VFSTAVPCHAALGAVLGILPDYVHSLGGGAVLAGFAAATVLWLLRLAGPERRGRVRRGARPIARSPDRARSARARTGARHCRGAQHAPRHAAARSRSDALVALVAMAVGQGLAVPSLGLLALASVPPKTRECRLASGRLERG